MTFGWRESHRHNVDLALGLGVEEVWGCVGWWVGCRLEA
jgi:hypothetical protein